MAVTLYRQVGKDEARRYQKGQSRTSARGRAEQSSERCDWWGKTSCSIFVTACIFIWDQQSVM